MHLILFPLPDDARLAKLAAPLLSAAEQQRARRLVRPADRHRFIIGRALIRLALTSGNRGDAAALRLQTQPGGKPICAAPGALHFNLSHSGSPGRPHVGLLAIADDEVGVDIECIRQLDDLPGMARVVLAPAEQAHLLAMPRPTRAREFLRYWTLKEAILKAEGSGFAWDPRALDLGALPPAPHVNHPVAIEQRAPARRTCFHVTELDPGPANLAAVAGPGPLTPLIHHLSVDQIALWFNPGRTACRPDHLRPPA